MKNFKKSIKWIILSILIVVFAILAYFVTKNEILSIDISFYNFVSKYIINDFWTPIFKVITKFSGTIILIVIAILLFIFIKEKKIGLAILINLGMAPLTNQIIKQFFRRPRPALEYRLIEESGFSFPSGHSMTSMAFYGFLIYLIYKKVNNKVLKWFLISLLSLLILSIGFSRIYLGVHYFTDVCAGFIEAICYLIVFITVFKKVVHEK